MDARMGEVFHAPFRVRDDGMVEAAGEERVSPPSAVTVEGDWIAAGNGFERYGELAALARKAQACLPDSWPRASAVLSLAGKWLEDNEPLPCHLAQPVYIRNEVAQKP
jgi:tRNA threonylcarbamoyladenosine biosynthesis protein TsaB